jgi:hypothetical protein
MAGGKDFDAGRFEQLVHYIAWKTRENRDFGRVRIAKVLFYVDFNHFADSGVSLTGASYKAEKYGPFPLCLTSAEAHLSEMGLVQSDRIDGKDREDGEENRVVGLQKPNFELDGYVQELVDHWINEISSISTARWLSTKTHDLPGWKLARPKEEDIPYETVFIGTSAPPDKAVERGRELIGAFEWD